jgi:hypothetical protein
VRVMRPRTKLVYFRVSDDEFQQLLGMCQSIGGVRSMSDLARSALRRLMTDQACQSGGGVSGALEQLREAISDINAKLRDLETQIALIPEHLAQRMNGAKDGNAGRATPDT